eukprot:GHVP01025895.1.p1 GENE.GHVP01025895.1~~GHVP01025895.1.p1  ORF type:complete len:112 (+),score=16.73 GHVP01025895.1:108-443(+)
MLHKKNYKKLRVNSIKMNFLFILGSFFVFGQNKEEGIPLGSVEVDAPKNLPFSRIGIPYQGQQFIKRGYGGRLRVGDLLDLEQQRQDTFSGPFLFPILRQFVSGTLHEVPA